MAVFKAECGCEIDCWVTHSGWGGCCCGECYNSWGYEYEVEDITITKPCDRHSGLDDAE